MLESQKIKLSFSIVSHGQGALIEKLLSDFECLQFDLFEIIITLNFPENEDFIRSHANLPIRTLRNTHKKGFGENHNAAFNQSSGEKFIIVNPDIRLPKQSFAVLWEHLTLPLVGACAPMIMSASGQPEDSARAFPTPSIIIKRFLKGHKEKAQDYDIAQQPIRVDWVAGMFIAFNRNSFAEVNGFDQSYFMYYEDVDICMRLKNAGYDIVLIPEVRVIHDARRTSRKNLLYLRWHMTSALRFTAKNYWHKFKRLFRRIA